MRRVDAAFGPQPILIALQSSLLGKLRRVPRDLHYLSAAIARLEFSSPRDAPSQSQISPLNADFLSPCLRITFREMRGTRDVSTSLSACRLAKFICKHG